jgi:hypothetical protein
MVTRGIREFMSRDWDAVRRHKDRYWAARIARLGPLEGYRASDDLRQQALERDPTWPSESQRREDLAAHRRLSDLLSRVDATRRG